MSFDAVDRVTGMAPSVDKVLDQKLQKVHFWRSGLIILINKNQNFSTTCKTYVVYQEYMI